MNLTEILVLLGGLGLGYGVVAMLVGGKRKLAAGDKIADAAPSEPFIRGADDAPSLAWPAVLEVAAEASLEDIRAAYRRRISQYHPDKVASLGPELQALAERKSKEIARAYQQALVARGEPL